MSRSQGRWEWTVGNLEGMEGLQVGNVGNVRPCPLDGRLSVQSITAGHHLPARLLYLHCKMRGNNRQWWSRAWPLPVPLPARRLARSRGREGRGEVALAMDL